MVARFRFCIVNENHSAAETELRLVSTYNGTSGRRGPGTAAKVYWVAVRTDPGSSPRTVDTTVAIVSAVVKRLTSRFVNAGDPPLFRRTSMMIASVVSR